MDGIVRWPNDSGAIAVFEVRESDSVETFYSPTWDDIAEMCDRYDLNFEVISDAIRNHPESHTFIIVAETFRAAHRK